VLMHTTMKDYSTDMGLMDLDRASMVVNAYKTECSSSCR
jgi:hypothetical protein